MSDSEYHRVFCRDSNQLHLSHDEEEISEPECRGRFDERERYSSRRKLWIASGLCLVFMIAEIVGGILSNSLAILSDAAHLFSDLAGFLISLFALYYAKRPATKVHSFGYHRAEILGALGSVSLIWGVTIYLVIEAIDRIKNPEAVDGEKMFIVALIGLIVNILMAKVLHHHHHHHHHGSHHDSHHNNHFTDLECGSSKVEGFSRANDISDLLDDNEPESLDVSKPLLSKNNHGDLNLRAAFIHVVGDILQSLGVLIASIIIWNYPEYRIADPICTFLFSIIVLFSTMNILRDAVHILMEGTPKSINPELVSKDLCKVEGVKSVHDLHIWSLTSGKFSLVAHINVDTDLFSDSMNADVRSKKYTNILDKSRHILCSKYNIHHSTIQIEIVCNDRCHMHEPHS